MVLSVIHPRPSDMGFLTYTQLYYVRRMTNYLTPRFPVMTVYCCDLVAVHHGTEPPKELFYAPFIYLYSLNISYKISKTLDSPKMDN